MFCKSFCKGVIHVNNLYKSNVMGLPFENASAYLKTVKRKDINKCFDKINENVRVNRAPVQIRHSGQDKDSGHDIFEKENLIKS